MTKIDPRLTFPNNPGPRDPIDAAALWDLVGFHATRMFHTWTDSDPEDFRQILLDLAELTRVVWMQTSPGMFARRPDTGPLRLPRESVRGRGLKEAVARAEPDAGGVRVRIDDERNPEFWLELWVGMDDLREMLRAASLGVGPEEAGDDEGPVSA